MPSPDLLSIAPLLKPPSATVHVPGSKSITNRALVLAALAGKECELRGALDSEDTAVMVEALRALGFVLHADWPLGRIQFAPNSTGRTVPAHQAELFVANSGTSMRFLTALVSLGQGTYRIDGSPRMRQRPIEDLLTGLRSLEVDAVSDMANGCPPVTVHAAGLRGGKVEIKGGTSSQFLSALLLAAPRAQSDLTVLWRGPHVSWPYISMTVAMLKQFGAVVDATIGSRFLIPAPQEFGCRTYVIESDASAASYFFAAAAVTGGEVTVVGLNTSSIQGDIRFADLLEQMGCVVVRAESGITVRGGPLHGIDVEMNDISDTVMTLAAVACFAQGSTTIRNVAHIRLKETDRLTALATEVRRIGAKVDERADGLTITPAPLHGAQIETYDDHRMAMSLALVGLKTPGIAIKNPGCVGKTYPGFFEDLDKLRR